VAQHETRRRPSLIQEIATVSVIVEFTKLVLEEVIGAGLSGVFHDARSRKAQFLKWGAWGSLVGGMTVLQYWLAADGHASVLLAWVGAAGILGFFVLGALAAAANAIAESEDDRRNFKRKSENP
jgi:hypothetical protein